MKKETTKEVEEIVNNIMHDAESFVADYSNKEWFRSRVALYITSLTQKHQEEIEKARGGEREKYEPFIDFTKSFEKKSYDAWKPIKFFRSDRQFEDDEVRQAVLEALWDEAKDLLQALTHTKTDK